MAFVRVKVTNRPSKCVLCDKPIAPDQPKLIFGYRDVYEKWVTLRKEK